MIYTRQNILARIKHDGDHWLWMEHKDRSGYGRIGGKSATRKTYELFVGPIPEGLELGHIKECPHRHCVNPAHLRPMTHSENNRMSTVWGAAVNLAKTHCPKRHEYTPENTYRRKLGQRVCATCAKARVKRNYDRKRGKA